MSSKVKFANEHDIPFLTYNGHHGALTTLGRMEYGIEIYLPQLNSISIKKNGKSATIGGGINSKNLVDTLWAAGKQTGKLAPLLLPQIGVLTFISHWML